MPDETSALVVAKRQGSSVQVDGLTTADSTTLANPDGSLTLHQDYGVQRVKQADGSWAPVDLTWTTATDGQIVEKMPAAPVTLSAGGDSTIATQSVGGGTIQLQWDDTLPAPTLSGTTATYADVRPGIDLLVQAIKSGYEVSFVVRERPTAPVTLPLSLDLHGLSASQGADGSLSITDSSGDVVGHSETPFMFGAAVNSTSHLPTQQETVTSTLASQTQPSDDPAAGSTAQSWLLSPDTSFLSDPATTTR